MPVERSRLPRRKYATPDLTNSAPHQQLNNPIPRWFPPPLTVSPLDHPFALPPDDDGPPPLVEPPPTTPEEDDLPPPLVDGPPPGLGSPSMTNRPHTLPPTPVSESSLFPEPETDPGTPTKPSHHKKRPADHIPRPPNAFILFRASFIKGHHIPGNVEPNNNTLSRIIGLCWRALPENERQIWKNKAQQAMEEHKRLYPSYRYNPRDQQNRAQSAGKAKRKVKEIAGPPPDPERCQEIARMLVEGKKGNELEAAVKELDVNRSAIEPHATEVKMVTRFDDPMTEKTFRRRSASVPPPAKDESQDTVPQLPPSKPKKVSRKRSLSTGSRNGGHVPTTTTTTKTKSEVGSAAAATATAPLMALTSSSSTKREEHEPSIQNFEFSGSGGGASTPFQFYVHKALQQTAPKAIHGFERSNETTETASPMTVPTGGTSEPASRVTYVPSVHLNSTTTRTPLSTGVHLGQGLVVPVPVPVPVARPETITLGGGGVYSTTPGIYGRMEEGGNIPGTSFSSLEGWDGLRAQRRMEESEIGGYGGLGLGENRRIEMMMMTTTTTPPPFSRPSREEHDRTVTRMGRGSEITVPEGDDDDGRIHGIGRLLTSQWSSERMNSGTGMMDPLETIAMNINIERIGMKGRARRTFIG